MWGAKISAFVRLFPLFVTGAQIDYLKCAIHLQRKEMLCGKPKYEAPCSSQPQQDVTVCISWGYNPKCFWPISLFPQFCEQKGEIREWRMKEKTGEKNHPLFQTNWQETYIFWLLCHFSCHVLDTNASQIQKCEINWPSELLQANTRGRACMIRAGLIRGHKTQQAPRSPHAPCRRTEMKQMLI